MKAYDSVQISVYHLQ